ncbi:hypothetical protein GGD69_004460, partial [Paraburkholderia fungorum]|nr:hypothetical protein [Paraburkholderia fungorum]
RVLLRGNLPPSAVVTLEECPTAYNPELYLNAFMLCRG